MRSVWILLVLLLFVPKAEAAKIHPTPEDCSTTLDEDHSGTVNDGCPHDTDFTASGDDYVIEAEDCVLLAPAEEIADTNASGGSAVRLAPNSRWGAGYLKCPYDVGAGTYYLRVLMRSNRPDAEIWVDTAPFMYSPKHDKGFLVFDGEPRAAYEFDFVNWVGTAEAFGDKEPVNDPKTFALSGTGAFYIALSSGVVIDMLCLSAELVANCSLPESIPNTDYIIFELGANSFTIDGVLESAWNTANAMPMLGFNSGTDAKCCCRMVWDNNVAGDRLYLGCTIIDTRLESATTANDNASIFNDDAIEVTWKQGTDTDRDEDTFKVTINHSTTQSHLDRNYPGGVADTGYTANVTKAQSIIGTRNNGTTDTDGSWTIEAVFDLGFDATPGDVIRLDLSVHDRDGGGQTFRHAFGIASSIDIIPNWGFVVLSNTALPGVADTTPPTVTNTAETNITQTAAVLTADTNEAGTCVVEYDINSGVPYDRPSPPSVLSNNGKCTITLTGLTANTQYFWRMRVTDAAGNPGFSAQNDFTTAAVASACDHYAAPNGSGTVCTNGSPCLVSGLWALADPGDVLCLKNGTYTGAASMIQPPTTLSGTPSAPITIKAENDGGATIDGDCARRPVDITGDYWHLEGFNAHSAQDSVVRIQAASFGGQVRRVVAWDAGCDHSGNEGTTFAISGDRWLVEDSAAFGIARKHFDSAQGGDDNTFRRVFCRWEQRPGGSVGPSACMTLFYNHFRMTLENAIFNRDAIDGNQATQSQSVFGQDGVITGSDRADSRIRGSIGYIRTDDINCCGHVFSGSPSATYDVADSVFYIEPGGHTTKKAINVGNSGNAPRDLRLTDIVGVSNTASTIGGDWVTSNVRTGTSLAAAIGAGNSVFDAVPGICFRYVNGVRSTTPLWPWPMNQRIIDAMTAAGKTPIDVTDTIEDLLGNIPVACGG